MMAAKWGPIADSDITPWAGNGTAGVYFSICNTGRTALVLQALRKRWPLATILTVPALSSRIVYLAGDFNNDDYNNDYNNYNDT